MDHLRSQGSDNTSFIVSILCGIVGAADASTRHLARASCTPERRSVIFALIIAVIEAVKKRGAALCGERVSSFDHASARCYRPRAAGGDALVCGIKRAREKSTFSTRKVCERWSD